MEWSSPHAPGFYWALGLGLAALLALGRRFASAPAARSLLLLAPRAAVLAILLVILLGPTRVTETRLPARPASAVYLVDCSRSMALEKPTSRLDRVKEVIARGNFLLPEGDRPRIELFGFGESLAAFPDAAALNPVANESRLRTALEQLPARIAGDLPRGVVVFSDGRVTEPGDLAMVAQGYRKLGVPIHVVPVGDARGAGDVALQDVIAPREARSGTRVPVRVVVRARGFAGERAEVRITAAADGPDRPPLASLPVTLTDGEVEGELVVDSDRARGPLVAEVVPMEREAVTENNRVPFQISARDPKVRVIYMEGTGFNEYHWIRDALVEDPEIECLAMEVDYQYNVAQRLRRVGDPRRGYPVTREELFTYDVVICSDINRGAFTQPQLDWTAELVAARGGGFAMIGGNTSFGAGQWDRTVWDGLIPIDMSGSATGGDGTVWEPIKVKVPRGVEGHAIWKIADDSVRNRAVLDRMPVFTGSNFTDRLKPAATALGVADVSLNRAFLRDPATNGFRPLPGSPSHHIEMPIFSCQAFGKGRTFAMSSDSTNDWGHEFERSWGENDNRYFRKFWRNVVRWLAENSANANRRLRVETDKVSYHPGETVRLTAVAFDEHLERTQRYRLVARPRGDAEPPGRTPAPRGGRRTTSLSPRPVEGDYSAEFTVPPLDPSPAPRAGPTTPVRKVVIRVTALDGDATAAETDLDVQVMDDSPEYRDPRPDPARLEELARSSGGSVLEDPADLADLLRGYRSGSGEVVVSKAPVWDHPTLWACLVGLLTFEWVARRARGLA